MSRVFYHRIVLFVLVVCIVTLPLNPFSALAQQVLDKEQSVAIETKNISSEVQPQAEEVRELAPQEGESEKSLGEDVEEQIVDPEEVAEEVAEEVKEGDTEGLSTWAKVGIGLGVALVAGVAIAAGGGSDDPSFPTQESMVGTWNAQAIRTDGSDSYTGSYTLYNGGVHTYDIFVASDGERKRGNGNWSQPTETYSLSLRNDTGSLYQGEFASDNFSNITLITSDGRWKLTLTKM